MNNTKFAIFRNSFAILEQHKRIQFNQENVGCQFLFIGAQIYKSHNVALIIYIFILYAMKACACVCALCICLLNEFQLWQTVGFNSKTCCPCVDFRIFALARQMLNSLAAATQLVRYTIIHTFSFRMWHHMVSVFIFRIWIYGHIAYT